MVLLAEAGGLLEGAHDEGHGCQLGLAVTDLIFIQGEGLWGWRVGYYCRVHKSRYRYTGPIIYVTLFSLRISI